MCRRVSAGRGTYTAKVRRRDERNQQSENSAWKGLGQNLASSRVRYQERKAVVDICLQ